jgi:DNA-binding transcriptional regulator YiaG
MTDMNETTEVMMKTDRRGRLRYTAQQKQAFLEAFESSGLSGPQFASLHGVHYQTLVSWLRKRRQASGDNHRALQSLVLRGRPSIPSVSSCSNSSDADEKSTVHHCDLQIPEIPPSLRRPKPLKASAIGAQDPVRTCVRGPEVFATRPKTPGKPGLFGGCGLLRVPIL